MQVCYLAEENVVHVHQQVIPDGLVLMSNIQDLNGRL